MSPAAWVEPRRRGGLKRFFKRHAFKFLVLLPTLLSGIYFIGYAAPQYESEARFVVRSRSAGGGGGAMADAMQAAGFKPASEEAVGVREYLQSHDAVAALRNRIALVDIFRRDEADPIAKLWWPEPPAERLLDYYRRMVKAEYDSTSGLSALRVRSFRAEDSQRLATELLALSEDLVNRLNARLQADSLRVAREEVAAAEARLTAIQLEIASFRERERAVDPTRAAGVAIENIGKLDAALAQARAEYAEAQRFARGDNPRLLSLQNRIAALSAQVDQERTRLGATEAGITTQVGEFERLSVQRELARNQLASATTSLERARVEAQRQQLFLLRVVEPNLAEYARYPKATLTVLYIFLGLSVGYGLAWLLVAGMREHAA